jgi:HTH-type transcriptional regulator / antitoxin HipB
MTWTVMLARTPADLGIIIRDQRRKRGLGQAELAHQIGVSRQWIVGVEKGRSRAELGLVLKALNALGLRIDTSEVQANWGPDRPNIDAIVADARMSKR